MINNKDVSSLATSNASPSAYYPKADKQDKASHMVSNITIDSDREDLRALSLILDEPEVKLTAVRSYQAQY